MNTEEFTGGELRFPEFGDQRYRPDSGAAIVFSSALLHEALEVESGRRLVLLEAGGALENAQATAAHESRVRRSYDRTADVSRSMRASGS